MSGFVAMSRKALDHPLLQDGDRFRAWFWLVANAAWRPKRVKIKGSIITLERGELSFSVRFLAENWGWSKSRVDRFLADLRAEGMIATRSKIGTSAGHNAGQGQSIISICNYEKYQDPLTAERDKREPEIGTTAGQQRDKEEQVNKNIPLPNGNGAGDFWAFAVAYLGEGRRSLIGKWRRDYGQAEVANAITAAQLASAVEPVAYIEKTLRRTKSGAHEFTGPC
jgi:hypothetical protein